MEKRVDIEIHVEQEKAKAMYRLIEQVLDFFGNTELSKYDDFNPDDYDAKASTTIQMFIAKFGKFGKEVQLSGILGLDEDNNTIVIHAIAGGNEFHFYTLIRETFRQLNAKGQAVIEIHNHGNGIDMVFLDSNGRDIEETWLQFYHVLDNADSLAEDAKGYPKQARKLVRYALRNLGYPIDSDAKDVLETVKREIERLDNADPTDWIIVWRISQMQVMARILEALIHDLPSDLQDFAMVFEPKY